MVAHTLFFHDLLWSGFGRFYQLTNDGPTCDQNGALRCLRAQTILDKTLLLSVSNLVLINS